MQTTIQVSKTFIGDVRRRPCKHQKLIFEYFDKRV